MNEITRPIEVITQEINFYKLQAGNAIIEIGKRLHEAKLTLPHGAWGAWLQNEVEFSERTAQNFMRIAKEYRNPQLIADMGNSATKALLLLSLPAEEREEFVGEAHEIDGEENSCRYDNKGNGTSAEGTGSGTHRKREITVSVGSVSDGKG